jgi:outer membrane protein assembly factor BamB
VDPRVAVCLGDHFALIVGSYVVCLAAPTGAVLWEQQCGDASCFGLHRMPTSDDLIVHGESEITRLAGSGAIVWQSSGRDIFTGPFTIESDGIYATDWNGDIYYINPGTGKSRIIGRGVPFPLEG